MADIDSLKFSIILDDEQFKKEMEHVEKLTSKFEKSVRDALAIADLLTAAQENLAKATEKRVEGSKKSHAATEKELDAIEAMEEEEQKIYNLIELREKRESEMGQLTDDEVSALKQMESIQKALLSIDEKHKTNLAEEFQTLMETDGMTKQQIGSYQSLVTQMQAATSETAKREAMEKAALMMREQKENAILNLKKTIAGIDQKTLSNETRAAIQKGINGELTAKELGRLQTIISTEQRRYALSQKNQAEVLARDRAITALRTKLVGIDLSILSAETRQKIEKAIKYELDSKEIGLLSAQVTLEKRIADEAARREPAEEKHASAIDSSNTKMKKQSELMRQITSYAGTYLSVFGAASLVRNVVRITGEFEAQRAALRAILMDAAGADRIFYQLQELAVKSPYTFRDLTSYAKQLSAFSVPMNEIYDTTKKLADVSAGLGVDMSRIILAYGQVRSAAFLRGQEVRQFTEAGIPILAELAKQFEEIEGHAVSTGEVFDRISKRQVPFEMVEEAFRRMTAEGGKFYNMQEVLAATVKGKVSNLQDAWEIMLSKVGDANSGLIKGSLSLLTELIKNYEKLGNVILEVTVAYGAYKATLAATNAIQSAAAVSTRFLAVTGERVTSLEALAYRLFRTSGNGLAKIGKLITKHPIAAAIAVAAAGVTALILHLRKMNEHLRETDKITSKAIGQAEASKSNIHYYIQRLKEAKEGTEEYNKARQDVIDQAGNFISATDAERLSLENVDEVWVNICNHIEEATRLQAMQSVTAQAAASKQEAQLGVMDALASYQTRKNNERNGWFGAKKGTVISNESRQNIASYIRGEIGYDELVNRLSGKINGTDAWATFRGSDLGDALAKAKKWRSEYEDAERIYNESIQRAQQNMNDLYAFIGPQPPEEKKALEGWRVRVDEFIKAFGGGDRGMKVTNATDLASYIKKGADALNDARDAIKHTPVNDADYKAIEKEIKFYEGISETIYGKGLTEFDNTTRKAKQDGKDAKSANWELIENIKQEYQDLKELKEWYDKFRKLGFDDSAINGIFTRSYGRGIPKDGFASAFEVIATKLENAGDANGARDIRNYANGRDVNTIYEKKKALDSYLETFQRLLDKAQEWDGTGVTGDISKAIADYNRAVAEATTQTEKLHDMAREAGLGDSEDSKHDDWFATQQANALAKLTKLIVSKDDALLKEILSGYDLTNWTDKSVLQIEQIGKALKDLEVPDEIKKLLEKYPELLAALEEALRQLADKTLRNTVVPEKFKATKREVKELVSEFKKLSDSAGNFAEKLGNAKLSGIAHGLSDISSIAESAVKSFSSISEKVSELQSMAANEKNANSWLSKMFGENGVFGVNNPGAASALGAGAAWASAIVGLNMKVLELAAKDEERWKREQSVLRSARNAGRMQGGYTGTIFGGSDLSSIRSRIEQLKEINASIEKYRDSAAGMQLTTRTYSFWHKLFGFFDSSNWKDGSLLPDEVTTLGRAVERLGMQLYDEYGNLNADTLNKIKEQYGDLSDEEKDWIDQAIADTEQYAEAMKPIEEIMNNLFGQVADDMVDRFLDNFHRVGNAVDDLGDTFTNLGETILRSFLHSYIIDEIMSKYQKTASAMMTRYASGSISADDYAKWLSDFTKNVEEDTKNQSAAINGLIDAFNSRQLINWGDEEDESGSLGRGMKSITEETANLLASYLNAIRADVSYGKTQWERIAVAVEGQGRTYITLNDYMQQVAANTFDTAQSNREILQQMRGFIRDFSMPSNMGDSIKVQVVSN